MMENEILINPIERDRHSLITETTIGSKLLTTPTYIPKTKKYLDFKVLLRSDEIAHPISAICFNIDNVERIFQQRRNVAKQYTIEMESLGNEVDEVLNTVPIIIDPQIELFYYDMKIDDDTYMKDKIFRLNNYPQRIANIFSDIKSSNHNQLWWKIYEDNLSLSLINWYMTYQASHLADVIIPPVPLIDGLTKRIISLADYLNNKNREIVIQRTSAKPAYYIPLHYNAIRDREILDLILEKLQKNINFYRILFLKIVWYNSLDKKRYRDNLKYFLGRIDDLKAQIDDNIISIAIDASSEGWYMMSSGIDGYIEPLDGKIGMIRGKSGGKKGRTQHGSYLDKKDREFLNFTELLETVNDNDDNVMPCDCPACRKYHGNLSKEISTMEWNEARRAHQFNARMEEIVMLKKAIQNKSVRKMFFRALRDGDKTYADLLPDDMRVI